MQKIVEKGDTSVYGVIAPNMGKQIVAFQAAMNYLSKTFPGVFKGYTLEVIESHQRWKKDTSGTAKDVCRSFNEMGVEFKVEDIVRIREGERSMKELQVPEEALGGHAFHRYKLRSRDGSVEFEFRHNVCGRRVYAEGTIDAVLFLDRMRKRKEGKRVFNMLDVLKGGEML